MKPNVADRTEFSIPEVAVMLGKHRGTIYWRVLMGRIPAHEVQSPDSKYIRRTILAGWLKERYGEEEWADMCVRLAKAEEGLNCD